MSYYSFDDTSIGLTDDNEHLVTRELSRPPGLRNHDWYQHAAATCRVLNAERVPQAELRRQVQSGIDRLNDMLLGDDGQAWKEAERALPALYQALDQEPPSA